MIFNPFGKEKAILNFGGVWYSYYFLFIRPKDMKKAVLSWRINSFFCPRPNYFLPWLQK